MASKKPRGRTKISPIRLINRMRRFVKDSYRWIAYREQDPKKVLFIFGKQRSGTSHLTLTMAQDWNSKVYGERSKLFERSAGRRFRLKPLDSVAATIAKDRAQLIVLKPLTESQHAGRLLDYFPGSKAVWMLRDSRSVALSSIELWGAKNSLNHLQAIVDRTPNNWRAENIPDSVREVVKRHYAEDMDQYDAAALTWFVRNSLFFQMNLAQHPDVMLCKYEVLITEPTAMMEAVYRLIDLEFPGNSLFTEEIPYPLDYGQQLSLSPPIENLCRQLQNRLDDAFYQSHQEIPRQMFS